MGILQKRAKDGFLEGIGIVGERKRRERKRRAQNENEGRRAWTFKIGKGVEGEEHYFF